MSNDPTSPAWHAAWHNEGTPYVCPRCLEFDDGDGRFKLEMSVTASHTMRCPNCHFEYTLEFLADYRRVKLHETRPAGHMWADTAHEEPLIDALIWLKEHE